MKCQEVFLQAQTINDIRKLKIPPAQSIDLSNNSITSLIGLPSPKNIKFLQVAHNKIQSIEEDQMKQLKSLCLLNLADNQISKIENLFYLNHLHVLDLSNNNISALENLEGSVNLKQLIISDNKIQTIFIRSPVPQLILLDISGNKLRRLSGIANFQCLSTLTADRNLLTSITQIKSLLNLRRISFCNNQIENFEPFFLPMLHQANFSGNKITNFIPFSQFQALIRLDLTENPITDSSLKMKITFPQLKELHIDGTQITDLSPLTSIAPNLIELTCRFCQISSLDKVLNYINSVNTLQYFDIRANPVNSGCYLDAEQSSVSNFHSEYSDENKYDELYPTNMKLRHNYRSKILNSCNELTWLDGIKIKGSGDNYVPPSELFFQELEDINIGSISKDLSNSNEVGDNYSHSHGVQCDLSDSVVSSYSDVGEQTSRRHQKHHAHRNNNGRRNDVYISDSNIPKEFNPEYMMKYAMGNSDDDSEPPFEPSYHPRKDIPLKQNNNSGDYSEDGSSFQVTADSAPYPVDFQKMGLEDNNFDVEDNASECFSAATDIDSDFFPHEDVSYPKIPRSNNVGQSNKKGSCSFWIDMNNESGDNEKHSIIHRAKIPTPQRSDSIPPFRNTPMYNPHLISNGHYPFNTKEPRRLPWDFEPDIPLPKPKQRKGKKIPKKKLI